MDKQGDKKKTLSLGSGKLTLGGVSADGATTPPPSRGTGRALSLIHI